MSVRSSEATGTSRCESYCPPVRILWLPTLTPKFIKRGSRVFYRWSDVLEWLECNTFQRTDDPRRLR
jgi:hypothetical protein